jgi:hypothetical protein
MVPEAQRRVSRISTTRLAVGGSGGGNPASGSYPAEMLIDWVRVF